MQLILIACSGKKTDGGTSTHFEMRTTKMLSKEYSLKLLFARQSLANQLSKPLSCDLSQESYSEAEKLLPAYLRYEGILYRNCSFQTEYLKQKDLAFLIISALYGLIEPSDLIRKYDLTMGQPLPSGIRVKTFWKKQGLGTILQNYIDNLNPVVLHDLLPDDYRSALFPWQKNPTLKKYKYVQYSYQNQGQGSIWGRVRDLQNILQRV